MKSLRLIPILMLFVVLASVAFAADELKITDTEFRVGGSKDSGTVVQANPGDSLKLTVDVTNNQEGDADIEDVEVTTTWEAFNSDEDDYEDSKDEDLLKAGRTKSFSFNYEVPLLVDEGSYDVDIEVQGQNESNGYDFSDTLTITIEVDKKSHELIFDYADLLSEKIACDAEFFQLNYRLLNIGNEDEDITFSVTSPELGLDYNEAFELQSADDDDAVRKSLISLDLPENLQPKSYPITVKAEYGSREETKNLMLTVEKCPEPVNTTDTGSSSQTVSVQNQPQPGQVVSDSTTQDLDNQVVFEPVAIKSSSSLSPAVIFLGAIGILLVILLIVLIVVVVSRKPVQENEEE